MATQNPNVYCPKQFHHAAAQDPNIYCPKQFHHAATQDPGHGTKFVTLPSSLLCCEFHIFIEISYICPCNR